MKVVHTSKPKEPINFADCIFKAKQYELNNEIVEAIQMYHKCIGVNPKMEFAYNRLMIIYRREKMYQKELAIVKRGIAFFEALFIKHRKLKSNNAIKKLSGAISKSTGLSDRNGKMLVELQPILKWKQRKLVIEKRLRAMANN